MENKIYRSKQNKVLGGVCGGLAEYFRIDPTLVRLLWVIFVFMGAGILAYIIAYVIIPERRDNDYSSTDNNGFGSYNDGSSFESSFKQDREAPKYDPERSKVVIGAIIVLLGIIFLLRQFLHWLDLKYLIPLILIIFGLAIIYKGRRNDF